MLRNRNTYARLFYILSEGSINSFLDCYFIFYSLCSSVKRITELLNDSSGVPRHSYHNTQTWQREQTEHVNMWICLILQSDCVLLYWPDRRNMIPAVRLILPFDSSDVLPSLVHLSPIAARMTASKPRMRAIIIRARQAWMYPTKHTHNNPILNTFYKLQSFTCKHIFTSD